jgi:hypothetical protein
MSIVGYHAIVTMHSAAWGDESGSVVTFKLPTQENSRNPFHAYTKRRSGKAGTRFHMACNEVDGQAIYNDEVMLAGWNDSQQNGHTVKFWIAADKMGHPFEGVGRKTELALALAELDDDNEPIDQQMRERVESQGKRPSERPSYGAVMLCKNPEFYKYAVGECGEQWMKDYGHLDAEHFSKEFVRSELGISSRAELDQSEELRERYHENIYKPFMATQHGDPF